jgi:hypothetical protein
MPFSIFPSIKPRIQALPRQEMLVLARLDVKAAARPPGRDIILDKKKMTEASDAVLAFQ